MGYDGEAPAGLDEWRDRLLEAEAVLNRIVLGQARAIRLILIATLCRGHVLLEGDVGVGKTTLLRAAARCIGGPFARIEGTVDLMPTDLLYAAYIGADGRPRVDPGPAVAAGEDLSIFFFNEINRARPQVHALLLRMMAERSVTAFQREIALPHLQVFADRNQIERDETYELPAAARDRFIMEIPIAAPELAGDRLALAFESRFHDMDRLIAEAPAAIAPYKRIGELARDIQTQVHASEALQAYVFALWEGLRDPAAAGVSIAGVDSSRLVRGGASPRGASALVRAARAAAWLDGRDAARPEDVRAVFAPVMAHRTFLSPLYEPRRDDIMPLLMDAVQARATAPSGAGS
jgi:MoxR-like ATPase